MCSLAEDRSECCSFTAMVWLMDADAAGDGLQVRARTVIS
jgi:hypothetical protein